MLRDSRADKGYIEITGDGTQTRNFTSVRDIVDACMIAAFDSQHKGIVDVTSGVVTSMNEFASYFECPIKYVDPRKGDTPHIHQSPEDAERILGWKAKISLAEEMDRCL
jgi:UDP-glucose 4-epimerase